MEQLVKNKQYYKFSIYGFQKNLRFFDAFFILFGMTEAFRSGTHKGMIMEYLNLNGWEHQAINYYGHTRSWSQMGSAISALLAGFIVYFGGDYQVIFLYSIFPPCFCGNFSQSLLKTIITSLLALVFGIMADHYGVGLSLIIVSGLLLLMSLIIELCTKKTS